MLFVFTLQSLIPVGYMPASLATQGTLIQFCPSGVSADMMAILHAGHIDKPPEGVAESDTDAQHHAHHGHHQHMHHQSSAQSIQQSDASLATDAASLHSPTMQHESGWKADCPFGIAGSGFDVSLQQGTSAKSVFHQQHIVQQLVADVVLAQHRRKQLSRAPPQLFS